MFRSLEAPRIQWLTFYCTCAYVAAIVVIVLTLMSAFTFMPKRSRAYAES
jgi:hypothetical protein